MGARNRGGFHKLRVALVERLCEDASAVTFEVPPELADTFAFLPGQFLTIRRTVDGVEQRRSYSIASALGAPPRIGVRAVPGGAISGWLVHDVLPGDLLDVAPAAGSFVPDLAAPGRHVFIAAGSGITPVLSIASSVLADGASRATIIYGNRRSETVMFVDDLADLKDAHLGRTEIVTVLSREAREVELFNGRLDAAKLESLLPAVCDPATVEHWWLCGPFDMVIDATKVLGAFGVAEERIHRELFYVEDVAPEPLRRADPAVPGAAVTVVADGRATLTSIAWDQPILDGAQWVRPDLPFACKGGVCGTCRAKVTFGEVRMRRNFALEPGEVDGGYVLTCQSLCVSENVTVDYDA